jgi:hypothetical protein
VAAAFARALFRLGPLPKDEVALEVHMDELMQELERNLRYGLPEILLKTLYDGGDAAAQSLVRMPMVRTASEYDEQTLELIRHRVAGSAASGNYQHKGRKGARGGSQKDSGSDGGEGFDAEARVNKYDGRNVYDLTQLLNKETSGRSQEELHDISDAIVNNPVFKGRLVPPEKMYHVTSPETAKLIERDGLKVGTAASKGTQSRGIYLTADPTVLREQGVSIPKNAVVFEVDTRGLSLRLDPEYYPGGNAKEYIRGVNDGSELFALYSRQRIPTSGINRTKLRASERTLEAAYKETHG